jgi:hypothetical protein
MPLPTALRVLAAFADHKSPQAADVEFLRKHALASEARLPADDLAREIVVRELAKRKPQKPR